MEKLNVIQEQIKKQTWASLGSYGRYFYPGRFSLDFDPQLSAIFNLIEAKIRMPNGELVPKHNKINVISWRGRGKTTIMKTLFAQRLRFHDTMFGVYIGKSHDWAAMQTEAIKRGMLQNRKEREIFGDVKLSKLSRHVEETFSKKAWMTNSGALVVPRGNKQPVRGLLHEFMGESYRLGLVGIDDLMDKQFVNSEQYRNDTFDFIMTDVSEAVPAPQMSMNWQILYIDTLKHPDACNARLEESLDWVSVRLPLAEIREGRLTSLAPTFYSDKDVQEKYNHYANIHDLDLFYQEFMCLAIASEDRPFQPEYFKYYEETDEEFLKELHSGKIENVLLVDPAKTSKATSAESAIVGVGFNRYNNKIYVRDIDNGHYSPTELYDRIFKMADRLRPCHVLGIEVNSLNEFIVHPLKDEMSARGLYFEIVELKPRRSPAEAEDRTHGKEGRVKALAPYYRKGVVYHNRVISAGLEAQLLSYPRPKRWDIADAFAYIVQILDMGMRYFEPQGMDDEEDPFAIEREYKELEEEYDDPFDDWRLI